MKTIKLLFCALCFFLIKSASALNPASTSTLVNPCTPQVTITPIPNTYGCYSITASNGIANDPDAYYQWSFQNGATGIGKIIYHCCSPVSVTTNYTLSLTYNSPALCGPLSNVQVFTITLNPPSSTHCVLNTPSVSLSVNSVTVWAGAVIPEIFTNYTYGDGSPTTNSYTHTYPACGNYIIQVNQWNMNTPNDTCYAYAAVNITCPNPTGIIDHAKATNILLFPNPVTDLLTIQSYGIIKEVAVFDLLGKKIELQFFKEGPQGKLYLQDLAPGSYFVKIELENGLETTRKFIKE